MIKKFDFPSFEKWKNLDKELIGTVGDYICKIAITARGYNDNTKHTFQCAISVYENPTNILQKYLTLARN